MTLWVISDTRWIGREGDVLKWNLEGVQHGLINHRDTKANESLDSEGYRLDSEHKSLDMQREKRKRLDREKQRLNKG
jgi:hypothetical protein